MEILSFAAFSSADGVTGLSDINCASKPEFQAETAPPSPAQRRHETPPFNTAMGCEPNHTLQHQMSSQHRTHFCSLNPAKFQPQ
jgi:hypothetical protein